MPVGTAIVCPDCGVILGKTKVEIGLGTALSPGLFDWHQGELLNRYFAACKVCGAPWFVGFRIHTEFGWFP